MILYHGSNVEIAHPDCFAGRKALDFGQGFYATDIKEQACAWAARVAANRGGRAVVSAYLFDRAGFMSEARVKVFNAYDGDWLDFIVRNRQQMPVEEFDFVEGGVADDRVIDSVRLYMLGLLPVEVTLRRLALHKPNNQVCFRNQNLLEKYLKFYGSETI